MNKEYTKKDLESAYTNGVIIEKLDTFDKRFDSISIKLVVALDEIKSKVDRTEVKELTKAFSEHKDKTNKIIWYGMGALGVLVFLMDYLKGIIIK